jgi:serine phosphatase RsbU (regulator of sigma subunit)/CHASE3 domain sensor protein
VTDAPPPGGAPPPGVMPPDPQEPQPARRPWRGGLTLHDRIQLLVTAFLVVLALSAVLSAFAVGTRDQVLARAERYDAARQQTNELLTAYIDQEVGVNSYVVTQDEAFLEPYEDGRQRSADALGELRRLLADEDQALLAAIDDVEADANEWYRAAVEPEIEATAQGRSAMAAAIVAAGTSIERFDNLRRGIEDLRNEIQTAQSTADEQVTQARRRINLALIVSFTAGALLLLATSAAMQRWSTQPLDEITSAVREVTGGDLDRRIPAVGPRDIAELGGNAEQMRRRIVAELDAARRAEQALRSRGAIVNLLRRELSPTRQQLPPPISVAAAFEPVKGVLAGDWYDVLTLDSGCVALCLIDVSGHGQSTGIFALQAKNLLLAALRQDLKPGDALGWLANALGDTGDDFLTCFVALINPEDGQCRYASAGHLPTIITRDNAVELLYPTGPLLGPLAGAWDTESVQLNPGSLVVAYTDGITEARGPGEEEFGEERLRAVVAARAGEHPQNVISTTMDAVADFAVGEAADDVTIVAVRWLPR